MSMRLTVNLSLQSTKEADVDYQRYQNFTFCPRAEGGGNGGGEEFLHINTDRFNNTFASRSLQFFIG